MRKSIVFIAGLLLGFLAGKLLGAPSDEVRAAVADLRTLPQERWKSTRYLSLANIEEGQRDSVRAIVGFVVNSVGRSATIQRVSQSGELVRLDVGALGINPVAWEALAGTDPYYHQKTQVVDPQTKKLATVYTDGGWVGLANAAAFRRAGCMMLTPRAAN